MLALALDMACLGSAHLIGISTLLLTEMTARRSSTGNASCASRGRA